MYIALDKPIQILEEKKENNIMSASPTSAVASTKRPLEDPSSPAGPTDLPDAKRQALDKTVVDDDTAGKEEAIATTNGSGVASAPGVTEEIEASEIKPEAESVHKVEQEPQPIPSTASYTDHAVPQSQASLPPQDETQWIHMRCVISSAEAATVIGKGGENVSQIRRHSGAKCTVSDYSRGAVERILTVSGAQDAVAKVRYLHKKKRNWQY